MKAVKLASSISDIAASAPCDALGAESRYVVIADLRMGDGGEKDESSASKKALYAILGRWYLQRGYTLILNGDIEDIRRFWLKDILAAWPEIYAVFDAFKRKGRLRKIVGERDLPLLRLRSYPYELSHALRIEGETGSILVLHGHQASSPFVDRDYLSDYMVHWLGSSKRPKISDDEESRHERAKTERRLYRVASRLGMIAIQGHTRRPLFESRSNRESIRVEVERLLREGNPRRGDFPMEKLIELYRRESRKDSRRASPSGLVYDAQRLVVPCLFSPGRLVGAKARGMRGLRMIEIEGDRISLVRWNKARRGDDGRVPGLSGIGAAEAEPQALEGSPYLRYEIRGTSLQGLFSHIDLLGQD